MCKILYFVPGHIYAHVWKLEDGVLDGGFGRAKAEDG
jgi:hypothetical protein